MPVAPLPWIAGDPVELTPKLWSHFLLYASFRRMKAASKIRPFLQSPTPEILSGGLVWIGDRTLVITATPRLDDLAEATSGILTDLGNGVRVFAKVGRGEWPSDRGLLVLSKRGKYVPNRSGLANRSSEADRYQLPLLPRSSPGR